MNQKYPFSAYDRYLCLAPNGTIWFILLYLMRPYVVMIMSITNLQDHTGLIELVYGGQQAVMGMGALASIPAMAILYAFVKRNPGAGDSVRRLWHQGRNLLMIGIAGNLIILALPFFLVEAYEMNKVAWIQLGIALYIIYELIMSQRIKDTFNDFPKPDAE